MTSLPLIPTDTLRREYAGDGGRGGEGAETGEDVLLTYPFTEEEVTTAYETWGCNCGPTAMAFALQIPLERVRPAIPDFESKRYTSPTMMKAALNYLGWNYTPILPSRATMFDERPALVRIQWAGPWTAKGVNPKWAYRQTHWVATWITRDVKLIFDCNGGAMNAATWQNEIVPLIVQQIPCADGNWFPTHVWRV